MKKYFLILVIIALGLDSVMSYGANPTPSRPTVEEQVVAVETGLKAIELALGDYFSTHNTFPDTAISLTTPLTFIGTIPTDLFNMDHRPFGRGENTYKYTKRGDGETVAVTIYSYGPDADDDNASVVYDPRNGTTSNGDIVKHVYPPAVRVVKVTPKRTFLFENQQISRASDDNGIKQFMWALKTAHYDPDNPKHAAAIDAATSVTKVGWQHNLHDLEALLNRNQQAFVLIREGAKKPYAKSVIVEKQLDFLSPYPNFFIMFPLSKLMIAEGKKFEAEGKPEKAVHNYIDTIKFGQSVGNGMLIGKLTCMAVETIAYKALRAPLLNSEFDSAYFEQLLEELAKLDQSSPPLSIAFWHERIAFIQGIEKECTMKNFLKSSESFGVHRAIPSYLYLFFNKRKVVDNGAKLLNEIVAYSKKPYPEAIRFNIASRLQNMDPITKIGIPKFFGPLIRETKKKTYARGVRIMAALELFKSRNNAYPGAIEELDAILEPIPLDPFTEKNFRYEKVGDAYRLYSAGPDMRDDFAHVVYDPKNGAQSAGDIIFHE